MKVEEIFKKLRLDASKKLLIVDATIEYAAILKEIMFDSQPVPTKII